MKKVIITILVGMVLVGCGDKSETYKTDNLLQPYIDHVMDTGLYSHSVPTFFGTVDIESKKGDILAVCVNGGRKDARIIVYENKWNESSEDRRIAIMAHEMSHCVHNISHMHGDFNLMSPYIEMTEKAIDSLGLIGAIKEVLGE